MAQANVYTTVSNAVWYTDKCEIVTGNTAVTYNTYVMQAGNPTVGILGTVTTASNVMVSTNASQGLIGSTFVTGTGVANTVTVVSAVNGQSLVMSANATANSTWLIHIDHRQSRQLIQCQRANCCQQSPTSLCRCWQ
jgi:hypothetical protein